MAFRWTRIASLLTTRAIVAIMTLWDVPGRIGVRQGIVQDIGVPIPALGRAFTHPDDIRTGKVAQRRIIEPRAVIHQPTIGVEALAGEADAGQAAAARRPLPGD